MTDEAKTSECAVWYMRHYSAYYELCEDEQQAVSYAYALVDAGEGAVLGVQFADGRLVERDEWQALADYQNERYSAWRDSVRAAEALPPPPPPRQVRDPFEGHEASVDAGDPDWLGAQGVPVDGRGNP